MGVVLSKTSFRPDKAVVTFSTFKILLFPALIWLGLETFAPLEPERNLYLLASAGPAGATAMNFALLYRIRTDAIAQVIIWTGILTLFTLAALA
jgi:predicted permease